MYENSWADMLTDGRIYRSLFYLFWSFFTGMMFVPMLIGAFSTSFALSLILIGIPLLVMSLAGVRGIAAFDRQIGAAMLQKDVVPVADDIERGESVFRRLGSYLSSPITWLSVVYMLVRFPVGIFSLIVALCMIPLVLLETVLLAPLGISRNMIAMHILNALASGIYGFSSSLLPTQREEPRPIRRRDESVGHRLELQEEPSYYIDDEGEIMPLKRKR
jgi:hypothetical protein